MADTLISSAIELGIILASIAAGGSYALRQIRRDRPSLTNELARELRQSTPHPEREQPIPRTAGEQIIASFGAVVREEVGAANKPLERRLYRLERQVDRLAEADDEMSRRIDHVEDLATGPITLELELDDGDGLCGPAADRVG